MNIVFPKNILIIDFESSLGGAKNTEPVQIGAILLDKVTLEEKKSFSSFIKTDLSQVPPERLALKGFDPKKILESPTAAAVALKFIETFGKNYFISSWVADLDRRLFKKIMSSAGIDDSEFDYHIYDLWPVAYTYLLQHGYTGSHGSDHMFAEFGLPSRGIHDALEDCRYAAQVLRKILQNE
ncbi:MAG: exonuclease domain-containing protein [Candidatus Magasanikbacteria bacterium]